MAGQNQEEFFPARQSGLPSRTGREEGQINIVLHCHLTGSHNPGSEYRARIARVAIAVIVRTSDAPTQ